MPETNTSLHIGVASGPRAAQTAEQYALVHTRRAARRLMRLVGRDGTLQWLADDIDEGNAFMREAVRRSHGEVRPATTVLAVTGPRAAQNLCVDRLPQLGRHNKMDPVLHTDRS